MSRHKQRINKTIRIGTRGSPLALWQAAETVRLIHRADPRVKTKTIIIKTSGDKSGAGVCTTSVRKAGGYLGKGVFVKELEEALLDGRVDAAIHSLKDVPADIPYGLHLAAYIKRGDPYDVFVSAKYKNLNDLPRGARVGTISPRRAAQTLIVRPDLNVIPIRGNVGTRLRKLDEGLCDAIILAGAGLKRLGLFKTLKPRHVCTLKDFIPAIGQGIVAIETRSQDNELNNFLRKAANDKNTEIAATAERTFLQAIGGDCHTPIAAYAVTGGGRVRLTGFAASPSGRKAIRKCVNGTDTAKIGTMLAEKFIRAGARKIIGLKKKTVLVTGLSVDRAKLGDANIIHLPLIKIVPPVDGYRALDRAIRGLDKYDWLIFTSKNAVEAFAGRCRKLKLRFKEYPKMAAVGPATAETVAKLLSARGGPAFGGRLRIDLMPRADFSADGLAAEFARLNLIGKTVLFPRAKEGRDVLAKSLKGQGAKVRVVEAYRTTSLKVVQRRFKNPVDVIVFSSPSAVRSYLKNFGRPPLGVKILCAGKTTLLAVSEALGYAWPLALM